MWLLFLCSRFIVILVQLAQNDDSVLSDTDETIEQVIADVSELYIINNDLSGSTGSGNDSEPIKKRHAIVIVA